MDREAIEEREAELGYSVRGEKEVRLREWFSLRENGEKPDSFPRLVKRLHNKKWGKAHPAVIASIKKRYDSKASRKARRNQLKRQRRHARWRERVFTCRLDSCGVQFCKVPGKSKGRVPQFCSRRHAVTAGARRRTAGSAPPPPPTTSTPPTDREGG